MNDRYLYRAIKFLFIILLSAIFSACAPSDPGPLSGTWASSAAPKMSIEFRPGESELQIKVDGAIVYRGINKVTYEIKDKDVFVTNGTTGITVKYTVVDTNTLLLGTDIQTRINKVHQ
jgi:hypothetical protein